MIRVTKDHQGDVTWRSSFGVKLHKLDIASVREFRQWVPRLCLSQLSSLFWLPGERSWWNEDAFLVFAQPLRQAWFNSHENKQNISLFFRWLYNYYAMFLSYLRSNYSNRNMQGFIWILGIIGSYGRGKCRLYMRALIYLLYKYMLSCFQYVLVFHCFGYKLILFCI